MDRIVKFGKTIRNNWKKSVFGTVAFYYGAAKAKEQYDINILMRAACKEAAQYGDTLIPMDRNPTLITVILNPVANKRKAKKDYEKYCEPLLHLAGLQVDVIQTTSEGNAKEVVETLRGTEAIIVAGGDGTLLETVTGLLRRNDGANNFPIGILPLGRTNTLGETLFPGGGNGVERVKQLIKSSMAIIKGNTVWKDAMKIEPTVTDGEAPNKPIFALSSIEWGAFRDALATRDYYWIYGPLKEYAAFVFNGYKKSLNWECKGTIKFTPPCSGCSNCIEKKLEPPRRWLFFTNLQAAAQPENEKANYVNSECLTTQELCFKTCDFKIKTPNVETPEDSSTNALKIILGKPKFGYTEFVLEGWTRVKVRKDEKTHGIFARTIEFSPNMPEDKKVTIGIDQEDFEVKPIKITLLPQVVKLFCDPELKLNQKN